MPTYDHSRTQRAGDSADNRPVGVAWSDPSAPVLDRVRALLGEMTLEEKVAQLYGVWIGVDPTGADVAPHQHDLADADLDFGALIQTGLGQLTRPFGTAAVDATAGAQALARLQSDVVAANRFGIPALVHEECLTGFMTAGATVYPTPLAWGATFDAELVERMAAQIGGAMQAVGVHQGLAPVLDVTRDPRWGRTEETIGEDPYLVGTIGTAFVRGLQSAGVIATVKHFVGYSASVAGRNLGPVSIGPRELADVLLPPFEMAVRDGGVRSVMHSYTSNDGSPAASDRSLLTDLLRTGWGFDGTVVADYFGVSFLELLHAVAGSPGEAASLALSAGVDVELPTVRCFGEPLLAALRSGTLDEALVDRAAERVLVQKCELGLLDADWQAVPAVADSRQVDLDPPAARALARQLAEESVVLLANDGALPLRSDARVAVVGPVADDPFAMLGCYTFPSHHGRDAVSLQPAVPSFLASLRDEMPGARIAYADGCDVESADVSRIQAAVRAADDADVCLVVLGDQSGLFGRGTSGEGCDRADLHLPGVQQQLLEAVLDTRTPVVLVLLAGRPYALGDVADRLAGIVQAFFPGEEGGPAVAGVVSGRVGPSGRLPISVPRGAGGQPTTYLATRLGQRTEVSSVDPTPLFPFGFGLSYTSFAWDGVRVGGGSGFASDPGLVEVPTDGSVSVAVRITNTGTQAGAEVVQLYLHDSVAQVSLPHLRLIGYRRVAMDPGESRVVTFDVHADLSSFTGRSGQRIVEPGELELGLGRSSTNIVSTVKVTLVGEERVVGVDRQLLCPVRVD